MRPQFRENEIDETVLPGLTAEDLKELGVASLGHRRKLDPMMRIPPFCEFTVTL